MFDNWIVTGAGGQLGSVLLRELTHNGEAAVGTLSTGGPEPTVGLTVRLELTDFRALGQLLSAHRPRIILHTAAVTSIDAAWQDPERARRTNIDVTAELARWSDQIKCRLVFVSTDLVFDGTAAPYGERDATTPLSVYGSTKAQAEKCVLTAREGLVLRPALMYGLPAVRRPTTFLAQLKSLQTGQRLRLFEDEYRTPIWLEDAARACMEAARSDVTGVLHIGGPQRLSRLEMGCLMAQWLGVAGDSIIASRQRDMPTPEPRPPDVSLDSRLYKRHFGHPAGRPMAEALAAIIQ
jgi:dTDP-4-dehydrorhamnose reductase